MTADPGPADPADLIACARAGDPAALGRLLEGHRPYLTLLARTQLGRAVRAKVGASDVVQDTFLEANRDFPHFRGATGGEFAGWLRQVLARNLANEARRYRGTQARDVRLEQSLAAALDRSSDRLAAAAPADRLHSPSHAAARAEAAVRLAGALAKLPDDYRQALVLRNLEDLSFPEVAERMGRSVDSVKKLWARGLAQLRRLLPENPDA